MISNEQRREVAGKLRSLDERIEGMPLMCTKQEHNAMALRAIRAVVGKGDIFHLLADLIDRPTTKRDGGGGIYWRCTRCGAFNRKDAVTDCCGVIPSRYCANCGAGVVE
jgi:hypothetical protein